MQGRESEVRRRLDGLAKPPGSLALLEDLAVFVARAQDTNEPTVRRPRVIVFAGDHGVATAHPVSAFPASVTPKMIETMLRGRSAVCVLAEEARADVELVDVGVALPYARLEPQERASFVALVEASLRAGTDDLVTSPAMTRAEAERAMALGAEAVDRAVRAGVDLLALGELGIGNTTPATALAARLLDLDAAALTGPGTGLDAEGVKQKAAFIERALARNGAPKSDPLGVLADLGGFELAASAGAILRANALDVPVLLDGFILSAAALVAVRLDPSARRILQPATRSAEPGHDAILEGLGLTRPIFDAGLRLGEGSGAALAIPVVVTACAVLARMSTLAEVLA